MRWLRWAYLAGDSPAAAAVVALVLVALAWRRAWPRALSFAFGTGGVLVVIDLLLKPQMARLRPPMALADARGASFPSGHVAGNLVLYGILASWAIARWPRARTPILACLILWTSLTALSCLAVRAHWPLDVVAGAGAGLMWLALTLAIDDIGADRWRS
jgi:undecaprenyl-diphosphatase